MLLQDFTDLYAQLGLQVYAFSLPSAIKYSHNHILLKQAIHFFTAHVLLADKQRRYTNLYLSLHGVLTVGCSAGHTGWRGTRNHINDTCKETPVLMLAKLFRVAQLAGVTLTEVKPPSSEWGNQHHVSRADHSQPTLLGQAHLTPSQELHVSSEKWNRVYSGHIFWAAWINCLVSSHSALRQFQIT